ncbi:AraC family ligand binding domain-containing protein [Azotobacter chroococcum]
MHLLLGWSSTWQHAFRHRAAHPGGEGNLRFEGRHYRLRAGDTMLVLVPHDHCYWLETGAPGNSSGSPCTARKLSACNGPCWTSAVRCCA